MTRRRNLRSSSFYIPAAGAAVVALSLASVSLAQAAESVVVDDSNREELSLILYEGGLAQINETRSVDMKQGGQTLILEDVPDGLIPASLWLSGDGLRVNSQRLQAATLSQRALLAANLGKTIKLVRDNPVTGEEKVEEALVLSLEQGLILKVGDRIETNPKGRLVFESVPDNLRAETALLADAVVDEDGPVSLDLRYLANGFGWDMNYIGILDEKGEKLDLQAQVTLHNQTGLSLSDARVHLFAGQVNRSFQPKQQLHAAARGAAVQSLEAEAAYSDVAETRSSVSDRDLYSLPRAVTLAPNQSMQVPFLTAQDVQTETHYRFDNLVSAWPQNHQSGRQQASLALELDNEEAKGLGKALPAGLFSLYQASAIGPVFVGEVPLQSLPVDAKAELPIGQANAVFGKARQTDYQQLSKKSYELAQEITLTNSGDSDVTAELRGWMPNGEWEVLEESLTSEKLAANRIGWTVELPKGQSKTLAYRLRVRMR
ncbi:DUF4139 domain-containing protein [Kiloniella sp. b19]|uniref:DUF4139 domain-containing protein n=1 Tax=Kiloniella sp. GXU_MW_B19 TaxID=3141326 RepID=UPI0031D1AF60